MNDACAIPLKLGPVGMAAFGMFPSTGFARFLGEGSQRCLFSRFHFFSRPPMARVSLHEEIALLGRPRSLPFAFSEYSCRNFNSSRRPARRTKTTSNKASKEGGQGEPDACDPKEQRDRRCSRGFSHGVKKVDPAKRSIRRGLQQGEHDLAADSLFPNHAPRGVNDKRRKLEMFFLGALLATKTSSPKRNTVQGEALTPIRTFQRRDKPIYGRQCPQPRN